MKPFLRSILIFAIILGLAALVLYAAKLAKEPLTVRKIEPVIPPQANIKKFHFAFTTNLQCRECHEEVWEELRQDQHFYAWFNSPFLAQDPKKTECNNCHAPQPILEVGYDNLAVIRNERFEEGVGCIECHKFNDEVHGPLPAAEAECNPRFNPVFKRSNICNACHAAHGTFDEWKSTKWAKEGITCQACHMPEVERPSSAGGAPRKVRSHKMLGPRDIEFIKSALAWNIKIENSRLEVSVSNVGAAHNVPGEINNREVFLLVKVVDAEGKEAATYRESFRAPPRLQRTTLPSTQLKAGETRSFTYDLKAQNGEVTIKLGYKLIAISFLMPDDNSPVLYEKSIQF